MSLGLESPPDRFIDRRRNEPQQIQPNRERRQFSNSLDTLSPDAAEFAAAIDTYKLRHRRRFITYEEMLSVVRALGYHK